MSEIELSLVVIRSHDIDTSAEFYRSLGLTMIAEKHGDGPKHYAAELGRSVLEIYPLGARTPTKDVRLGFMVSSVDEIIENLGEDLTVQRVPAETDRGYLAVISDPDGHTVEIVQRGSSGSGQHSG